MAGHTRKSLSALDAPRIAPGRAELQSRYREVRALSRKHNSGLVELATHGALLRQARRLGLAHGKTFLVDDPYELAFAFDLLIHTSPPDRPRLVDRYLRSVNAESGSDDARVLEAMRSAHFSILYVERRHPVAGLVVRDLTCDAEFQLMDEGLESSAPEGSLIATRLYILEDFCMTAGVAVPLNAELLRDALDSVAFLSRLPMQDAVRDRRFAEAVYRLALADGIKDRIVYKDAGAASE
ncbi:hypothetical protein [Phenylobacterium sp.]|uniref:hypothetical protein n=1 Tax=Phenylobacterium sp. TaxID=1871053 RepID=UPI0027254458|nr:hypothetical protein [Phenylobacterium sp.]MDO8378569.1 hypothetical protein [Phenylobacterium sp.]